MNTTRIMICKDNHGKTIPVGNLPFWENLGWEVRDLAPKAIVVKNEKIAVKKVKVSPRKTSIKVTKAKRSK